MATARVIMKKTITTVATVLFFISGMTDASVSLASGTQAKRITVRTENYPRPPYSGATYYIYERDGETICTKLEVCNKYDDCDRQYKKGPFKEDEDVETGEPYGKTDAVVIPTAKLKKHVCLTRFKLLSK